MTERQHRIIDVSVTLILTGLLAWGFWSFFRGQVVFDLFASDAGRFRDSLASAGSWAMLAYVCLVLLEVLIAFIPGWFVYPVGAAIFGLWPTVALVMTANFIGGGISFWIGRRWGKPLLERFISKSYLDKFDAYMERSGTWAVFILKINPITSLDIWNYVAGTSPIKFWKFMAANLVGILPLVIFSAALGEQSYNIAPQFLGVLLLLTALYVIWFFVKLPAKIRKIRSDRKSRE